jgi:transcriptional regulator GlxA family with amidase domain
MKLRSMAENEARQIATVLFDDFELLDVCGPLEVFGVAGQRFSICLVGPSAGPVRSAQGTVLTGTASPRPEWRLWVCGTI